MLLISRFLGTRSRHSIEGFMYFLFSSLHTELIELIPITYRNKDKAVETIRALSEELI